MTRRSTTIVIGLVVLLALPYGLSGPSFHADDFLFLNNAHFDGVFRAAEGRQLGRPGALLTYDLTFGLLGQHPLAIYFFQVGLWIAAAVSVLFALRRFLPSATALAVALVWLVVPSHTALEHWASTTQALLALCLLAIGVCAVARAADRGTSGWAGAVALAAAVASYEVTAAMALVTIFAVPWLRQRRIRWGIVARGSIAIGIPLIWASTHRVYTVSSGHIALGLVLPAHLSLGLEPFSTGSRLLTAVALVGVLLALIRILSPRLRGQSTESEVLAVAGLTVIIIGVLPLIAFASNFYGMDDRLTVVSGVGAAMIWVGIVGMAARAVQTHAATVIATLFLIALVIPVRIQENRDWVDTGRAATVEIRRLAILVQTSPVIEVPGPLASVGWVTGLHNGWNATAATQLLLGRRDVVVHVIVHGASTGP
jgi:hypothetical protein